VELHSKVSGFDFYLGVEIGIPPCLDRCIVLCSLCAVTSNVHTRAPHSHGGPPNGAFPNGSHIPCRPQVLEVVFLDYLETSNISKGSSEALSPSIDYPSSRSGSLVLSRDNNRLRVADRRTCLARRQKTARLGGWCSSWA
jgi:hypothetical protein